MTTGPVISRPIGTMVAYGFADVDFDAELAVARRLGARVLEIFPEWRREPDPRPLRRIVGDAGLSIHSAHGCWAGQTIRAQRVDLGQTDPQAHRQSVDDLKRCVDWLRDAGGTCLVVHPGGLSDPDRAAAHRAALAEGLSRLADHAQGSGVVLCVENMPPGVHPGSRMADLAAIVAGLGRPEVALALDTGHAQISADPASETLAAGALLRTTHVHDNDGKQDTHLAPGRGTVDWDSWARALDAIDYRGPIMLECIRQLRKDPAIIDDGFLELLRMIGSGGGEPGELTAGGGSG
jgi:sugar phosphate isomerase/epimerase